MLFCKEVYGAIIPVEVYDVDWTFVSPIGISTKQEPIQRYLKRNSL